MPGDGVKIATQGLHINRHMDGGLRAVDQHGHALCACPVTDGFHINDGAKHVRHMGDGNQPGARGDGVQHGLGVKVAGGVAVDPFQHDALTCPQKMPRDDVGVMFEDAEDDLVTGLQVLRGPGVRDQIDRLGCAGGEDNGFGRGVQEPGDFAAGGFVMAGGEVRQIVKAPVNVGVFVAVGQRHCVDHLAWFLRGSPVVEVDEGFAVDLTRQDRKVLADCGDVIGHDTCSTSCSIRIQKVRKAIRVTTPRAVAPGVTPRKPWARPCSSMAGDIATKAQNRARRAA